MSDPLVSIVLRSFNEGWALRETLPALAAQDWWNREVIVIDSGSTDGSVELLRSARPSHFIQISPEDYVPGRVLNHGVSLARGERILFLNADATPQGRNWLRPLATTLADPSVAAVFGRQIPRPGCRAVYAHDYERCFGPDRDSANWDNFFSLASSGIRRDVWEKRRFDERLQYSEDDEYSRWARYQGWQVRYVPDSVAMHSHNYTPDQAWRRAQGEGRALAAVWPGTRTDLNWLRTVALGMLADARRDLVFCLRNRRLHEWPHAIRIRLNQRRGRLAGFRQGWADYRNSSSPFYASNPVPANDR